MNQEAITILTSYRGFVKQELSACISFWLEHGMDKAFGGIYTCLDREGTLYSTDKSVWMQGRCAWIFSFLCETYGARPEWLAAAKSCLDFLEAHCINRDKGNRMYFTVTKEGKPLRQRRYCFSEAFYCIASAQYGLVTGEEEYLKRARDAYDLIWGLNRGTIKDPVGLGPKTIPETRGGRSLADPMIYLNLCSVLRKCDPANATLYDRRADQCVEDILRYHDKPEMKCTLESVGPNGEFDPEVTAGRVVNPGHAIECSWFLMEHAKAKQNEELFRRACRIFENAIQAGWDEEYGGILYFRDCLGKPTEAYEHDMKLWWPHNEAMIASLMAYEHTRDMSYLSWFIKIADYCKRVFSDPEHGEWYGYLRRDGKPTEPAVKGSTFKGPFHLPRMLVMVDTMMDTILGDMQAKV